MIDCCKGGAAPCWEKGAAKNVRLALVKARVLWVLDACRSSKWLVIPVSESQGVQMCVFAAVLFLRAKCERLPLPTRDKTNTSGGEFKSVFEL